MALAWRDLALDAERSPDTSRCGLRGAAACSIESSAGMLLSRPVDRSDLRAVEWLEKWLLKTFSNCLAGVESIV